MMKSKKELTETALEIADRDTPYNRNFMFQRWEHMQVMICAQSGKTYTQEECDFIKKNSISLIKARKIMERNNMKPRPANRRMSF